MVPCEQVVNYSGFLRFFTNFHKIAEQLAVFTKCFYSVLERRPNPHRDIWLGCASSFFRRSHRRHFLRRLLFFGGGPTQAISKGVGDAEAHDK